MKSLSVEKLDNVIASTCSNDRRKCLRLCKRPTRLRVGIYNFEKHFTLKGLMYGPEGVPVGSLLKFADHLILISRGDQLNNMF